MRVIVCGGRDYSDTDKLSEVLNEVLLTCDDELVIIQGGASGADRLAERWAQARGLTVRTYRALWGQYGKRAGPIRNQRMVDEGRPDLVVSFPGGRGTADMVRRAHAAGLPVREVELS